MSAEADARVFRFHYTVAVRFRDLDPMGHAHHAMPLIYLEEARAAYWRDVVGRQGIADIDYVMAEIQVRYLARIGFPARLDVALRTSRLGNASFEQEFEIRGEDGTLFSSGRTVQVMFDYAAGRSMRMPPLVRGCIESFENSAGTPAADSPR